ncbi:MAG: hypothetical protein ACLR8L_08085 [Oscillospiraceae bacterium]
MQLACVDGAVFVRVEGDAIYRTEKIVRLNAQTLETETEFSCDGLDIQRYGKGGRRDAALNQRRDSCCARILMPVR